MTEQIQKLRSFLKEEKEENPQIQFWEDPAMDNRFALTLIVPHKGLCRKMAEFYGCPPHELPAEDEMHLAAQDHWHGRGKGNLRDLADEIGTRGGAFFDVTLTKEFLKVVTAQAPKYTVTGLKNGMIHHRETRLSLNEATCLTAKLLKRGFTETGIKEEIPGKTAVVEWAETCTPKVYLFDDPQKAEDYATQLAEGNTNASEEEIRESFKTHDAHAEGDYHVALCNTQEIP